MKHLHKSLVILLFFVSITQVKSQWEEEQDIVLAAIKGQPVKTVKVSMSDLRRTYFFDFQHHLLRWEFYDNKGVPVPGVEYEYDDQGFLTHETKEGANFFNHYDMRGNLMSRQECYVSQGKDSTKQKVVAKNTCGTIVYQYDENFNRTIKLVRSGKGDSTYMAEAYQYDGLFLVQTRFYTPAKKLIYTETNEYNEAQLLVKRRLAKDAVDKVQKEWTYDEQGRVTSFTNYGVQYAAVNRNTPIGEGIIKDGTVTSITKFFYDKKGRVSRTESFYNGKEGPVLKYKYEMFID